jgi:hypothetical protein
MFLGCTLYYLDISNFDFSNSKIYCEESEIAMSLVLMANYLNLYNAKNYYDRIFVETILLNQKENIFNSDNSLIYGSLININTNKKPLECNSNNYITVKYNNRTEYENGFMLKEFYFKSGFEEDNWSRREISFIIYQDLIYTIYTPLIIEANTSIQLHFNNPTESMEDFFNYEKDPNCLNIISIDLSHFNASLVKNTNNMFNGSSSLEYLDISNFRPINLINQSNAFNGVDKIKYINLYNLHKNLRQEINSTTNLNNKDHLSICQNRNTINNKNAVNVC